MRAYRPATGPQQLVIDFVTSPSKYRHWKLQFAGEVAELIMDVDENAGLFEGYQLKLIELADALQRLRFEHPEVEAVDLKSGKTGYPAPTPTSECSPARSTPTRSTSAEQGNRRRRL